MGNRIFQTILEEKIEIFKLSFSKTSREIFWNENENKLIHPGEFGTYREAACKEFLKLITPHRLEIGTGFLINGNDDISTQCDIVVYDLQNTPLIENSEKQRFFPVETVVSIGEIKSTLSKTAFKNTINKLARNKKMKESIKNALALKRQHIGEFNPQLYSFDGIVSFIICKKIDFDIKNISLEINDFYEDDIKPWQKHNLILSIDDGLIVYIDSRSNNTAQYPTFKGETQKNRFLKPDENSNIHFMHFCHMFYMATSINSIYHTGLNKYITQKTGGMNYDEP